jgi:hypothetical protein
VHFFGDGQSNEVIWKRLKRWWRLVGRLAGLALIIYFVGIENSKFKINIFPITYFKQKTKEPLFVPNGPALPDSTQPDNNI